MIKNILKGMVMGLANIIPGVSGGTMAVSMGIYDKMIHCITHLFKELKQSILFLLPIFVGMGIAIVGSSFGIDYLFSTFPLQTNFFFIGLILGSLPLLYGNVKEIKIKPGHMVSAVIFFALVVVLALLDGTEGSRADLSFNFVNVLVLFLVGIVASATMIIPGVSGSMMLLLLGFYNPILSTIKDFVTALVSFDIAGILAGCGVLIPFGLGVVFGIFAVAKLIEVLLAKYPAHSYWAIIGLVVGSPIAILILGTFTTITLVQVLVSVVTLALGFFISIKLGK